MHYASSQDMTLLDEIAVRHGLDIRQMMELAAWHMMTLFTMMGIAKQSHIVILAGKGLPVIDFAVHAADARDDIERADIMIDALLGYNISGDPRGAYAELITLANAAHAKIIAYDLPSGLNPNTGGCHDPCIKAEATLMLALAKHCCRVRKDREHLGKVYLADLGIPAWMYDLVQPGSRPHFSSTGIVPLPL